MLNNRLAPTTTNKPAKPISHNTAVAEITCSAQNTKPSIEAPKDPMRVADLINHPPHYASPGGLEVVEVMEAFAPCNAHRAQAIKYLLRAGNKGSTQEDLRKCAWWVEREIAWLQRQDQTPA